MLGEEEPQDLTQEGVLSKTVPGNNEEGGVIKDSINMGVGSFTPDLMFEQLVRNYRNSLKLFGPRIIRFLTGYEAMYVDRNVQIPEFQREIKKNIEQNVENLKKKGLIDKDGNITEKGIDLAALTMYMEELDNITPKGMTGERFHKKQFVYGEKHELKKFRRSDRYRDLELRKSIKTAVRRGHNNLDEQDLKSVTRQSKGLTYVLYVMDCSGSMKGEKLETAKKAGIALAYKALDKKDMVGWIAFNDEIIDSLRPTHDFHNLVRSIAKVRASRGTNMTKVLYKAVEMFPDVDATKHIIILSDALPTIGKEPERETLDAVALATSHNITISMIGISLDKKGRELGKKIVELGHGRLYLVKDLGNVDKVILEDYYEVM